MITNELSVKHFVLSHRCAPPIFGRNELGNDALELMISASLEE